ncbi:proteasome subunit beta type-2-like [Dermatophagoides pteronyssinus]|mgnify:CR=1 FL=1|uniref:Proteasome subunit beta n=2 Tax=Dermatophagoides pteronyssinus TaxID=6956 RepID=A0A6P6Y7U7_DERPT|nr:proteasome subunit beta type-2-like [Dermatophagoides pteronyssinus]KAH9424622.1 Proteasome subunit beta type-2 [Dermatophagoides pteronyssinus]
METIIGIRCKDSVIIAADRVNAFSIIMVKNDMKKIYQLNDNLVMAVNGDPGDAVQFAEYISKNIQLYKMRHGYDLSPLASTTFVQRNLANYLRSRTPYQVNLMMAGYDKLIDKPHLSYMDYLATTVEVPYGAHGYGSFFVMGLLDRIYKPDCTADEAIEMMKKCVAEIQRRLIINQPAFQLCKIDRDGVKHLDDIEINPATILNPELRQKQQQSKPQPMIH